MLAGDGLGNDTCDEEGSKRKDARDDKRPYRAQASCAGGEHGYGFALRCFVA